MLWIIYYVGSDGKESTFNAGHPGSIPGSGKSPGGGHGKPLEYSCLVNPMDRGAWWTTVHGVAKSQTRLSDFTFTFCITGPKDGTGPTWLNRLQEFPSCLPSGDDGFVTHSKEREKKNTNLKKQDKIPKKGPPCLHPFMPPFWWYSSSPVLT